MKGAPLVLALALATFLFASNARAVGARTLLQGGNLTYFSPGPAPSPAKNVSQLDLDILNFALNLECLEAEFYLWAAYGHGLNATERGGGPASIGGQKANLSAEVVQYATEIANDEHSHVLLLRAAVGAAAVPCPLIDVGPAFAAAANAATNATLAPAFNPYSGDAAFFLGAYVFEDVGVTAYHGALPLFTDKTILSVAGGLLGTEAYHAGAVRSYILDSFYDVKAYNVTIPVIANAISGLRNAVDGVGTYDQGPLFPNATTYNILPADANSLVFSRTPGSVIKIVTGGAANNGTGLFFPQGLNTAFTIKS